MSYTSDGMVHDSSDREYYLEGMKGNAYISNMMQSAIDQEEVITISVPILQDHSPIGVLRGTMDISELYHYFDLSFLKVSSTIIQSDGTDLIQKESGEDRNIFDLVSHAENNEEVKTQISQDFATHQSGSASILLHGKKRYAYYSPIEGCDWFVLTILPYSMVEEQLVSDARHTLALGCIMILLLMIAGSYIFYLQRENAKKIKQSNQQLDAIITNSPGTTYKHEVGDIKNIRIFNQSRKYHFGYTKEELMERICHDVFTLINREDYESMMDNLERYTVNEMITNTYRVTDCENRVHWVYDQRHMVIEDQTRYYYVIVLDITELKNTQELLKISEGRYELILRETQSVVFEWNVFEDCITFSDFWTVNYGYPKKMNNFLMLTCKYFQNEEHTYIPLLDAMASGKPSDQIECILPKADGTHVWVKIFARAIYDDQGYLLRIVGSISDISEEKRRHIQLMERAQKDGLTKLFNRLTIEHMIDQELHTFPDAVHALFVVDVDDFKQVNDTLGHAGGDEALQKISLEMKSCFRNNDWIGRIGGDEFVIFMKHMDGINLEQIEKKCQKLLHSYANIRLSMDDTYRIHCSIGVAIHPKDGTCYQELFQKADKRLYMAKEKGKDTYVLQDEN